MLICAKINDVYEGSRSAYKFLKEQKFSMAGKKRRDCDTRGRQSTDAQNMCDVHPWIFLRWKGKQPPSQVFADKQTEDILDFSVHLPTLYYFFFLVALASCHEMGFYNKE